MERQSLSTEGESEQKRGRGGRGRRRGGGRKAGGGTPAKPVDGTLITTTAALQAFVDAAGDAAFITIDTEFMRDRTYWPQLCLIQLGLEDQAVAVDPLAEDIDLAPLDALLFNPDILKVFHAGRQDLEIFYHRSGKVPAPIFDSQIAAMVCGFGESVGYDSLVQKLLGLQIDKGSRFTDWARRPLSKAQLSYALGDVTHLREIYRKLDAQLTKTGRAHWLKEEMDILADPATYALHPENAWRRLKPKTDKPETLAVLRAVAAWRETEAQQKDLPRTRILKDETLMDIAGQIPRSVEALSQMRSMPK